ncbi:MAG TPA: Rieske 2Fe-2S domain-containing protein [Amnibacterium sp.]|nr:Rieske 2Fe-2S domain-containing protein [Amnibacterium sp.]
MKELRILKPIAKLEDVAALDPLVDVTRKLVLAVVKPRALEDLLHGVPFGHPIHPVLVLVPTGAWASVAVLDLLPGNERAARILVGAGVLSALPTALTGETDWARLHEQQMRVGIVHAALNVTAVALYSASWLARRAGNQGLGKLLAFAGFGAAGAGGYLGGHLAYRQASGANHAEAVPHRFPPGWHELAPLDDLPEGELVRKVVKGQPLLVHRTGSEVRVLSNVCSHLAGPLHQGTLTVEPGEGACVMCPWHQSVFSLENGEVVHGPATSPQPVFETRVTGGAVEVLLPNAG